MQNELLNNNESMLQAIYQKLSSIEERVARTEFLLMEGKNIVATSVDTFDSILTDSSINKRLETILSILKKISSEDSLDKMLILLNKIEEFSSLAEKTDFISFFIDSFDDFFKNLKDSGVDISSFLNNLLKILPSLTDTKTFDLLNKLLENKDNILNLISISENIPSIINMSVDTFDEYAKLLKDNSKLNLLKNNLIDLKQDINKSINSSPENIGILDILKTLNDPHIRKEIFIALSIMKNIGNKVL
ncbi:MAG: DUF1641 domain-containing protein [Candidatus Sericytochromatia bacterium]